MLSFWQTCYSIYLLSSDKEEYWGKYSHTTPYTDHLFKVNGTAWKLCYLFFQTGSLLPDTWIHSTIGANFKGKNFLPRGSNISFMSDPVWSKSQLLQSKVISHRSETTPLDKTISKVADLARKNKTKNKRCSKTGEILPLEVYS